MEEILFRGIEEYTNQNEWVYGIPVPIRFNTYETKRIELVKYVNYDELDDLFPDYYSTEIKPETLCRFTGKYDMDNTPIYEHDILEVKINDNKHFVSEIIWCESHTGFVFASDNFGCAYTLNVLGKNWCLYYKVVGNIFDGYDIGEKHYYIGEKK